jgi:predicted nucleic acid-binding protein
LALFIDANVPVYALGRDHPLKEPSVRLLTLIAESPQAFITDSEVLQELLHRYLSLRLWETARRSVQDFAEVMRGRVESVSAADVESAAAMVTPNMRLQARDLVHLAVMARIQATSIVSADSGFDSIDWVDRLDPASLSSWAPRFGLF